MLVIGLTGNLGTGKSTVAAMFARKGAKVIDADAITRALLAPKGKCIKKVAKTFCGVILKSGVINRSELTKVVFQDSRALKKLTDILYPEALRQVKRQISLNKNASLIILDVPLLFESGWEKFTDITMTVYAKRRQQIKRLQESRSMPKDEVLQRLRFQMPMSEKLVRADIVIDNSGPLQATRRQVDQIAQRLLRIKTKTNRSK